MKGPHNVPTLLAAHHALGSVDLGDLLVDGLRSTTIGNTHVIGERRHEHARRNLCLVQHVVGLGHHAHRRTHVTVTAVARVLEHILVRGVRNRLQMRVLVNSHSRVIIVGHPPHRTQVIVLLGVRNAVQVNPVVAVARLHGLRMNGLYALLPSHSSQPPVAAPARASHALPEEQALHVTPSISDYRFQSRSASTAGPPSFPCENAWASWHCLPLPATLRLN